MGGTRHPSVCAECRSTVCSNYVIEVYGPLHANQFFGAGGIDYLRRFGKQLHQIICVNDSSYHTPVQSTENVERSV